MTGHRRPRGRNMTERDVPADAVAKPEHRFWLLLIALTALLIGYPYFENTRVGAFLGGVASLLILTGAVYAVRTNRWSFRIAMGLAIATAAASLIAFAGGTRGNPIVEATFSLFYAFSTIAVFLEVIQTRRVTADTMYGTVCVYLLVGMIRQPLRPGRDARPGLLPDQRGHRGPRGHPVAHTHLLQLHDADDRRVWRHHAGHAPGPVAHFDRRSDRCSLRGGADRPGRGDLRATTRRRVTRVGIFSGPVDRQGCRW